MPLHPRSAAGLGVPVVVQCTPLTLGMGEGRHPRRSPGWGRSYSPPLFLLLSRGMVCLTRVLCRPGAEGETFLPSGLSASGHAKHLLLLGTWAQQGSGHLGSCWLERNLLILKTAWVVSQSRLSGYRTQLDMGSSSVEKGGPGPAPH